jgi:uncharacterized membrane protein YgcG
MGVFEATTVVIVIIIIIVVVVVVVVIVIVIVIVVEAAASSRRAGQGRMIDTLTNEWVLEKLGCSPPRRWVGMQAAEEEIAGSGGDGGRQWREGYGAGSSSSSWSS